MQKPVVTIRKPKERKYINSETEIDLENFEPAPGTEFKIRKLSPEESEKLNIENPFEGMLGSPEEVEEQFKDFEKQFKDFEQS